MIKQKTVVLLNSEEIIIEGLPVAKAMDAIDFGDSISKILDTLLEDINLNGHAFIEHKITYIPETDKKFGRAIITVVYREIPTRKILIEKTND